MRLLYEKRNAAERLYDVYLRWHASIARPERVNHPDPVFTRATDRRVLSLRTARRGEES